MAVLLITDPSGARLPRGNVIVLVSPRARACSGDMITSSGSTPSCARSRSRRARRRSELSHQSSVRPSELARGREHAEIEEAEPPEVEHHLRHAAGHEDAHRRVVARAVRQDVDDPRDAAVDRGPVVDGGSPKARGVGDRREVEQQVGGPAEGRVDGHRVPHGRVGEDVAGGEPARLERDQRPRGSPRHVQPDRLARRRRGPSGAGRGRAPRRRPGRSPPCRGTGSRRPPTRRRGSPCPRRARA